jgi:UDP-GlcNAc:undecaprenyl-phosphate GlcNAc-1-phosphate transferase
MDLFSLMAGMLGLGITILAIPLILRRELRLVLARRAPDLHHTHESPVPRFGGVALAMAFVGIEGFVTLVSPGHGFEGLDGFVLILGSLAMFALGLWDDLKPVGAKKKLAGQILISLGVYACGIGIHVWKIPFTGTVLDLGGWGVVITVLWLVGMTNLINLIDGVDGLAGGICLMLMVLIAYVGHETGQFEMLATGMAGALLGFLWFNFPPARIYMGDGGAYFLGFQIGLITLISSHKGEVFAALTAPLFVLALPIADMSLAILRRGLRGLPLFRPDRKHIHHQLLNMGFSRTKVVLGFYAVTLVFLALGFVAFWSRGRLVPALLGITVVILLLCAGRLRFSRSWFDVGRVITNSLKMRQEVQYALCLSRLLALEGGRRESVQELWLDLVFTAQKLGFTSVKLTLADGFRLWEDPIGGTPTHAARYELQGGRAGVLELKAPSSPEPESFPAAPRLSDEKLFGIISELVAEGWVNATGEWRKGHRTRLEFESKSPGSEFSLHRRSANPVVSDI